ncbi:MAG: Maf family protein [Candidatus Shapirobacteria bacterium]|nr:Maf family protein [Candidatus Shapirobacteria bacterium]
MKQKIILASASKQRRLIMDSLGVDYEIIPADIDEKAIRDDDLILRAEKIARAKAEEVAKNNQGIIIAADTFAWCNGNVLEKPKDINEAEEMLRMERNNEIMVYSGFCYLDKESNIDFLKTSVSKIVMRNLSDEEIKNFVKNNPVTQWSAAFSPMYLYQTSFVEYFEGSINGVSGLPTEFLVECLEKSGVEIKGNEWKENA